MHKRGAIIWALILSLAHYLTYAFLYQGVILPCSDSNYYLWLSQNLSAASPDRPTGYPAMLFLLRRLADFLSIPFWDLLPFVVHAVVICASVAWAKTALGNARAPGKKLAIGFAVVLIQLVPLTLLYSSAIFMTDPVTIYLVVLTMCLLAKYTAPKNLLAIALLAGLLGLLRSGMVVTITLFAAYIAWVIYRERALTRRTRIFYASAALFLIFAPTAAYQNFYVRPLLGTTTYGFIGGRCALTQLLTQLDCPEIAALGRTGAEKSDINRACVPGETRRKASWETLWDPDSFFTRLEKINGDNRAAANKRYEAWAVRGAIFFPGSELRAAYRNVLRMYDFPLANEFLLLRPYGFQPNCLVNVAAAFGETVDQYYVGFAEYVRSNRAALQIADHFDENCARYLFSAAMLLLLWPLAFGWRPVARFPLLGLAYLIALEKFLACSAGVYYDTRHFMSFATLSFFQFTLFLGAVTAEKTET